MANHAVDLRHVRDNLGHESLNTTSGYLHSSNVEGHRDTEEKRKINGWSEFIFTGRGEYALA